MRLIFPLFLLLAVTQASSQPKVGYYLPKKVIYVSVPFTITQTKLYNIDPQTKKPEANPTKVVTIVKVDGDIKVESKLFPGEFRVIDLSSLGKGGKSFDFAMKFDDNGNGLLSTVNASQTPVTADIIKGTVNIASSVLKLATSVFGFGAGDEAPSTTETTSEQKIVEIRAIELTSNESKTVTINPSLLTSAVAGTPASVEVTIAKGTVTEDADAQTSTANNSAGDKLMVHYRVPAQHTIEVKVMNNQLVKEQLIISQVILIPQTGKEIALDIPVLKKKKTVEIAFDAATGSLSKYSLKKESQLSDNIGSISTGIGTLNTEISGLRTVLAADKEKAEEKVKKDAADKKQAEDDARNKDIKDEIEALKLEKERMDLIITKQGLQDQINEAKKKAEADKAAAAAKNGSAKKTN